MRHRALHLSPCTRIGLGVLALLVASWATVAPSASAGSHPIRAAASLHRVYSVAAGDIDARQYKPRLTYLTGDGTLDMHNSHWAKWTATTAVGTGIAYVKNCKPDCGQSSKIAHVKMHLREYDVKKRCGFLVFTRYAERLARKPFPWVPQTYTAKINHPACNN
jgi:hypothetical protein